MKSQPIFPMLCPLRGLRVSLALNPLRLKRCSVPRVYDLGFID